jgi:hypothetical protein
MLWLQQFLFSGWLFQLPEIQRADEPRRESFTACEVSPDLCLLHGLWLIQAAELQHRVTKQQQERTSRHQATTPQDSRAFLCPDAAQLPPLVSGRSAIAEVVPNRSSHAVLQTTAR